jgi:hypothetical protein
MFWRGDRPETPAECARRTLVFLEKLGRIDPLFAQFEYTTRKRGKYVHSPVPLEMEELSQLFATGVNRRDSDRSVIRELGYNLWVSTRGKGDHAHLAIHCGCYDTVAVPNSCILKLSFPEPDHERLINVPALAPMLEAMADAFEPHVGNAGFHSFGDAVTPIPFNERTEFDMDWLMYFSREWGTVPPLPAPVRIEHVGDRGTLVILSPNPVSASNPEDVELGRRVQGLLRKASLLSRERLTG